VLQRCYRGVTEGVGGVKDYRRAPVLIFSNYHTTCNDVPQDGFRRYCCESVCLCLRKARDVRECFVNAVRMLPCSMGTAALPPPTTITDVNLGVKRAL
jgi:hypothetical protein